MSLTVDQAQLQLNTPKTISELFEIVANVSSDWLCCIKASEILGLCNKAFAR